LIIKIPILIHINPNNGNGGRKFALNFNLNLFESVFLPVFSMAVSRVCKTLIMLYSWYKKPLRADL